jgi:hypothetical protein
LQAKIRGLTHPSLALFIEPFHKPPPSGNRIPQTPVESDNHVVIMVHTER